MSVSVIIPAYNRAALLPLTLDAVLAQTRPADEIIVVDDGSTDGTAAVARGYGARVACITIANGGDLAARNVGLRAARGRLVAFCDSDDLWRPDFLAAMLAMWQAEPRTRAAYCDFVLVRNDVSDGVSKFTDAPRGYWDALRVVGPDLGVFDAPVMDRLIRFQPFFASCLVADRQAFLEIGGWDEGVSRLVGSDFATALRLAEHPPIGAVRRPLVGIRKHATNYSADVQAMNLGDARILEYVLATRPGLQPLAPAIRASIARRRGEALDGAFARRDFAAVREIARLLPPAGPAVRVKRAVATLPEPIRGVLAGALLALGSARGRWRH
jgi:glycosyltransferase involved in cell wall biosynthesis